MRHLDIQRDFAVRISWLRCSAIDAYRCHQRGINPGRVQIAAVNRSAQFDKRDGLPFAVAFDAVVLFDVRGLETARLNPGFMCGKARIASYHVADAEVRPAGIRPNAHIRHQLIRLRRCGHERINL